MKGKRNIFWISGLKSCCFHVFVIFLGLLLLPSNLPAMDWDYTVNLMRQRQESLFQEMDAARKTWKGKPDPANTMKYNQARMQYESFSHEVEKTAAAVAAAKGSSTALGTLQGIQKQMSDALETTYRHIGNLTCWLLGASNEDLYGANWQWAETEYAGVRAEAAAIRAELAKLKEKPDDARAQVLKERTEQVKKKILILRGLYISEAQNLGTANIFWGDTMGRDIEAVINGFSPPDMVDLFFIVTSPNPKILYDVLKPMMLNKFGDKFIIPPVGSRTDGLTPKIADEITTAILSASADKGMLQKALEQKLSSKGADYLKDKLLSQELLKQVLSKEVAEYKLNAYERMRSVPFRELPDGSREMLPGMGTMDDYLRKRMQTAEVRDRLKKEIAAKKGLFNVAKDAFGALLDWGPEILDLFSRNSMYEENMEKACALVKGWRQTYREKKKAGQISDTDYGAIAENTAEDHFVNVQWTRAGISSVVSGYKEPAANLSARTANEITEKLVAASSANSKTGPGYRTAMVAIEEAAGKVLASNMSGPVFMELYNKLMPVVSMEMQKEFAAEGFSSNSSWARRTENPYPPDHEYYSAFNRYKSQQSRWQALNAEVANSVGRIPERLDQASASAYEPFQTLIDRRAKLDRQIAELVSAGRFRITIAMGGGTAVGSEAAEELQQKFPGFSPDLRNLPMQWGNLPPRSIPRNSTIASLKQRLDAMRTTQDWLQGAVQFCAEKRKILDEILSLAEEAKSLTREFEAAWARNGLLADYRRAVAGGSGGLQRTLEDWQVADGSNLRYAESSLYQFDPGLARQRLAQFAAATDTYAQAVSAVQAFDATAAGMEKEVQTLQESYGQAVRARKVDDAITGFFFNWPRYWQVLSTGRQVMPVRDWGDASELDAKIDAWIKEINKMVYVPNEAEKAQALENKMLAAIAKVEAVAVTLNAALTPLRSDAANCEYTTNPFNPQDLNPLMMEVAFPVGTGQSSRIAVAGTLYQGILKSHEQNSVLAINQAAQLRTAKRELQEWKNWDRELASGMSKLEQTLAKARTILKQMADTGEITNNETAFRTQQKAVVQLEKELVASTYKYNAATNLLVRLNELKKEVVGLEVERTRAIIDASGVASRRAAEKEAAARAAAAADARKAAAAASVKTNSNISVIKDLYSQFKAAYESRSDMQIMALISKDWSAGDGTTLSDLQGNFRRIFKIFDEVRYNIQNLSITAGQDGRYNISYDVTITSRIYKRNLKHEEKSSINEEVIIDGSGKAKIFRTLGGRFWYVQ